MEDKEGMAPSQGSWHILEKELLLSQSPQMLHFWEMISKAAGLVSFQITSLSAFYSLNIKQIQYENSPGFLNAVTLLLCGSENCLRIRSLPYKFACDFNSI